MKIGAIKLEVILEVENFSQAALGLFNGLASHGVSMTPELNDYIVEWLESHTVTRNLPSDPQA